MDSDKTILLASTYLMIFKDMQNSNETGFQIQYHVLPSKSYDEKTAFRYTTRQNNHTFSLWFLSLRCNTFSVSF